MHLKYWALSAAFGLAGSPTLASTHDADKAIEALRARCPTTRNLAPDAFRDDAAARTSRREERQQPRAGGLPADAPPADAEVVLRASAGGSMTQGERTETETVVWRLPDGSWHFTETNHYPNRQVTPPPPPAMLTDAQIEAARRSVVAGPLDAAQAHALDRLLADPCLDAEPSIVAGSVPVRRGIPPMAPCFDAVPESVELVRAGRRRVFAQTCHHFLAGELIALALYPHRQGDAGAAPSQTLATPESARRYADQVLHAAYGGDAWVNVTDAAGSYAFIHRASGFRCAATEPGVIHISGPNPNQPPADGASCGHDSSMPVSSGVIDTEWLAARQKAPSAVSRRVRTEAEDWFSSNFGSDAHPRIRTRTVTLDGVRMARAEVAGEPHVDARDDELTIVLGAAHDGWTLVTRATGSASDPAAVEAAALREWHHAIDTRAAPQADVLPR